MSPRLPRIAGALYLLTVVTSIPALALKDPLLRDTAVLSDGASRLAWAGLLELVLAAACIGTAACLFPVIRRHSEVAALGFLAARTVEGALIAVGVMSMLSLATVHRADGAGADALAGADATLIALHDWAFLLGPGLVPAVNALCLGYALYRFRLVPRVIPALGLLGAPLLLVSALGSLFGAVDQVSGLAGLAALPIALWEISLGLWLVLKGVEPRALTRRATSDETERGMNDEPAPTAQRRTVERS
ncbi:DUF4386 domain-containing protein [Georgenia faecalis]|uniref:DUF4386 domain-containing protein n=1 Tax=Georgenia faecalis TaxID=2483799 RepID=A0ABV9DA52_9MICO|nr:DUF4386 domain-containing protein [Georgenia faecalis]